MTPHLAWSGGPGACDSSGSLRPHLHLTPRTRPNARRPPARRACTRGRWRAPLLRVGEGRRGRVKSPARAEDRAERRLSTSPGPTLGSAGPAAAPPVERQHRGANLHNNLAAAPGLRTGRGGGGRRDSRSRLTARPGEGAWGGAGARTPARALESPPGDRARPHSGGWGRGTLKQKRAGGPEQQLPLPRLPPTSGVAGGGTAREPEAAGRESHLHSE